MNLSRIYRSSTVGRIADWTSLAQLVLAALSLCGGSALLAWLASTIEPIMQYGWGAAVFAGLAAACLIILTLSVGAFAFRALVPSKTSPGILPPVVQTVASFGEDDHFRSIAYDIDALKSITQAHYEDFDKRFGLASQRIGEMLERIGKYDQLLKPQEKTVGLLAMINGQELPKDRFDGLERNLEKVSARILSNEDSSGEKRNEIVGEIDRLESDTYGSFQKVRDVFLAERILESYDSMTGEIDALISKMDDPLSKHEIYSDWLAWEDDFVSFKSQMKSFERFLRNHTAQESNLFNTPPDMYKSQNWSYNFQDLNEDQKMNYKTFRIISGNYVGVKSDIRAKLYNKTFFNF